jgi:hypothetical protein
MIIVGGTLIIIIFLSYLHFFANFQEFLNYFYHYPVEYSKNEPNKNPFVLLRNLIIPFNINILEAIQNNNLGLIIFYPVVLFVYLSYFFYFKYKIFKINTKYNFFFNFFLFSSLACGPMIGRNYSDVFWTIGALFSMIYYIMLKRKYVLEVVFKFFPIYLFILSIVTFAYPKYRDINTFYYEENFLYPIPITNKSMPFININDFISADKFIKSSIKLTDNTKFYVIDDNSFYFILTNNLNNISKNLYYDLNVTIPRKNKEDFYRWIFSQILTISKNNPEYVIKSTQNSKRLFRIQHNNFTKFDININDLKYFDDFILENYNLIFENKTYEIFEIIK